MTDVLTATDGTIYVGIPACPKNSTDLQPLFEAVSTLTKVAHQQGWYDHAAQEAAQRWLASLAEETE